MEWYKNEIAMINDVEMIWFNRDSDEDAMENWMKKESMPWPMIKFRNKDKVKEVAMHAGRAVPNYVMVDANNEIVANGLSAIKSKIKELSGS